jgi:putative restriction endonuclease
VVDLADYLDLTVGQAREQFRALALRGPARGGRQVAFLPAETLLCLAASFLVNHRHFGGATAHQAPEPVPSLARLFSRPPSSVLAKMANLDGSRSHGARWDALAGAMLRDDPSRFSRVYRVLLQAARGEGIGPGRLPDFPGLEHGGELVLLGQDELDISVLESALRDRLSRDGGDSVRSVLETERILLAAARVGQHVFAVQVLANCGGQCVFCGLGRRRPGPGGCCWPGISNRGRTARRPSGSTRATAWPPAPPTTWPSTPACSRSTEDCASTWPARWPRRYRTISWPGSTTGGRPCARCSFSPRGLSRLR